jgi:hypothetical protein
MAGLPLSIARPYQERDVRQALEAVKD